LALHHWTEFYVDEDVGGEHDFLKGGRLNNQVQHLSGRVLRWGQTTSIRRPRSGPMMMPADGCSPEQRRADSNGPVVHFRRWLKRSNQRYLARLPTRTQRRLPNSGANTMTFACASGTAQSRAPTPGLALSAACSSPSSGPLPSRKTGACCKACPVMCSRTSASTARKSMSSSHL
jgi:hypothetical protein